MRLQGAGPNRLKCDGLLNDSAMGRIVGNAMSVNIVAALMKQLLRAIGCI